MHTTSIGETQEIPGATQESVQTLINMLNASKIEGSNHLSGKKF